MSKRLAVPLLAAVALLMEATIADARVVKLVVEKTRPFADGKSFGDTGPYERLDGTVYLVKERFLLEEDARTAIRTAEDSHILKQQQSSTSNRVSAKR